MERWTSETVRAKQKELLFPNVGTYYEQALALESGRGMILKDVDGKEYLDFFAGLLTVQVGHCPPPVTEAAIEQQRQLVPVSTLHPTIPPAKLAEKLVQTKPMKDPAKVFFTNSGTEANETAVTLAKEATGRTELVVLRHNYGGRGTLALLSIAGKEGPPYESTEIPPARSASSPPSTPCGFSLDEPLRDVALPTGSTTSS